MTQSITPANSGLVLKKLNIQRNLVSSTPYFQQPDDSQTPAGMLERGEFFILGNTITGANNKSFVSITTLDGQAGFLPGTVKVYGVRVQQTTDPSTPVYSRPETGAPVAFNLPKGSNVLLTDLIADNGKNWILVRDATRREGYVPSVTPFSQITAPKVNNGSGLMISGALWCGGGIIATAIGYSNASSGSGGGSYMIFWGAILFGAWDFLKGLVKFLSSPTPQPNNSNALADSYAAAIVGNSLEARKAEQYGSIKATSAEEIIDLTSTVKTMKESGAEVAKIVEALVEAGWTAEFANWYLANIVESQNRGALPAPGRFLGYLWDTPAEHLAELSSASKQWLAAGKSEAEIIASFLQSGWTADFASWFTRKLQAPVVASAASMI
jgi:hypothetical protein